MNVKEIAEYIAMIDYLQYKAFLNARYGLHSTGTFKNFVIYERYMRHKMYVIAFDMIMEGRM